MDKAKSHSTELKKDLSILQSKLDALEVSVSDRNDKSMINILKVLVENQKHMIDEFDHLKKAIDLLTLQIFKVEKNQES